MMRQQPDFYCDLSQTVTSADLQLGTGIAGAVAKGRSVPMFSRWVLLVTREPYNSLPMDQFSTPIAYLPGRARYSTLASNDRGVDAAKAV